MVPPEILPRAWPIARLAQPKSTWFGAGNQLVPPMAKSLTRVETALKGAGRSIHILRSHRRIWRQSQGPDGGVHM
ncbi:MAG: hypothetical protein KJ731_03045 [Alphaproteobacteria bacterium]|nr:hypothetical protein [Alphaproteobacteria bacterium]